MHDIEQIKKNITALAALSEPEWDAVCRQCGLCCLHKIDADGTVYFSKYACNHCDLKNKTCQRFNTRFDGDVHCTKITLHDIIAGKYLPDNCAYVEKIFGPAKNIPDVNWAEIKQNPSSMAKIKKNIFVNSDNWALRTNADIIPELLEFIKQFKQ